VDVRGGRRHAIQHNAAPDVARREIEGQGADAHGTGEWRRDFLIAGKRSAQRGSLLRATAITAGNVA
jgi:hypothetical protein